MARRTVKTKAPIGSRQGGNLVVILGLTRDMLNWIRRGLKRDTLQKSAECVGTPSTPNDWGSLYKERTIADTVRLIDRESLSGVPHRIIVLYIPSYGDENLISTLHLVCFLAPLNPQADELPSAGSAISWRHNKALVKETINRTLRQALRTTNSLKAEITDKRISPLTLPAHNFYYPDRNSTISDTYRAFTQSKFTSPSLEGEPLPSRFTRNQLPGKAFKGRQYTDEFFQDCRGRVFPPDIHHAHSWADKEATNATLSAALRQRYRFGVTVRNGNLHYDVQYEMPRTLKNEPMYCIVDGDVWVTGSHANVGVNDFVWAPDGHKNARNQK